MWFWDYITTMDMRSFHDCCFLCHPCCLKKFVHTVRDRIPVRFITSTVPLSSLFEAIYEHLTCSKFHLFRCFFLYFFFVNSYNMRKIFHFRKVVWYTLNCKVSGATWLSGFNTDSSKFKNKLFSNGGPHLWTPRTFLIA